MEILTELPTDQPLMNHWVWPGWETNLDVKVEQTTVKKQKISSINKETYLHDHQSFTLGSDYFWKPSLHNHILAFQSHRLLWLFLTTSIKLDYKWTTTPDCYFITNLNFPFFFFKKIYVILTEGCWDCWAQQGNRAKTLFWRKEVIMSLNASVFLNAAVSREPLEGSNTPDKGQKGI